MANLDAVRKALEFYGETYRHPNLRPLAPSPVYSLFPDTGSAAEPPDLRWPAIWPNAGAPGVYLVFGPDMNLLYVGKASLTRNMGGRLSSYFQYAKDGGRGCAVMGTWSARPTFIITVGVDSDKAFEACALEEYLITRLQPPDNRRGVRERAI
jgi:hypothetical protein